MLPLLVVSGDIHRLAIFQRIGGINDDAVLDAHSTENLQGRAIVATNRDGPRTRKRNWIRRWRCSGRWGRRWGFWGKLACAARAKEPPDRKSTRLNSSHLGI